MSRKRRKPYTKTVWGMFDTQDTLWMGTNETGDGPQVFKEKAVAVIAAQMVDVMLRQTPGRTRAKPYASKDPKYVDEKKVKIKGIDALKGIEEGRYV